MELMMDYCLTLVDNKTARDIGIWFLKASAYSQMYALGGMMFHPVGAPIGFALGATIFTVRTVASWAFERLGELLGEKIDFQHHEHIEKGVRILTFVVSIAVGAGLVASFPIGIHPGHLLIAIGLSEFIKVTVIEVNDYLLGNTAARRKFLNL